MSSKARIIPQLARARAAGYHDDRASFDLAVHSRRGLSYPELFGAWAQGVLARQSGVRCLCPRCTRDD